MKPQAVIDTNVVVSGFLSPLGPPGRIVDWLRGGAVRAVLDERIFAEYREVLARPVFRLPPAEVAVVLAAIRRQAIQIEVKPGVLARGLPDPDDATFWECAWQAKVPLVTGNLRHFPKSAMRGVRVVTPAEFIASLPETHPEG